jgi:hypothetical protein
MIEKQTWGEASVVVVIKQSKQHVNHWLLDFYSRHCPNLKMCVRSVASDVYREKTRIILLFIVSIDQETQKRGCGFELTWRRVLDDAGRCSWTAMTEESIA